MSQVRLSYLASAALCAAGLAATDARADTITFNTDTLGFKANGFASASSGALGFTDTGGSRLVVIDGVDWAFSGQVLGIFADDAAAVQMSYSGVGALSSLSVTFGNDWDGSAMPTDRAWLALYSGATLVASVFTTLDLDPVFTQTLSYTGPATFDSARFYFGDASGTPIGAAELISSVSFERAAVSEPGSLAILGAGLLGLGLVQQRRRSGSTEA